MASKVSRPFFFFILFPGFAFISGSKNGYEKREDDPHHDQRSH
ncbi:hypothetical protein CHCC20375_1361 [Bacillus licheniformis]|nr:hypothetical protein CHCC20375_1361 [Bacillus licheniformis]